LEREEIAMTRKHVLLSALVLVGVSTATHVSAQSAQGTDWRARLLKGEGVVVNLKDCSGNIGTLKCGTKYHLDYTLDPNRICERVTGHHPKGPSFTFSGHCNSNPRALTISLFGAKFTYTPEGEVYSVGGGAGESGTKVGVLELP
jgi:hypothetical protein